MVSFAKRIILFILFLTIGGSLASLSFAENTDGVSDEPKTSVERKEELQTQLRQIQDEIAKYREEIKSKQSEERSLAAELGKLTSQISKVELELKQTALAIRATELSIEANNLKIKELSDKISHEKEIIAELMRAMYEESGKDMVELIMLDGNISDFVDHARLLDTIQASLNKSLQDIKSAKENIEKEQERLEEEKEEQERLQALQEVQNKSLEKKKSDKKYLLGVTKGEKAEFERLVKQKEKDIEQIRNQIFLLESSGVSMSLSQAYEIAKFASEKTGVRPAFLLAVLKQESSWGQNIGQCYLMNVDTGEGKGVNTGRVFKRVMKPTRDVKPFMQITEELGRDPFSTPVSCPHPSYGWGGAMGPAQFIPSTWMGYRKAGEEALGHAPNPFDLKDSFTVSAIKLANGGATAGTYDAEWKAAMMYYAGGNWNNPLYSFYGDSVMEIAAAIQEEINAIGG